MAVENRRQRRPGGNNKAVEASPPATTAFDDHVGLGEGNTNNYGGDCVLPAQRLGDEYSLKGGGSPADPGGSIATSL